MGSSTNPNVCVLCGQPLCARYEQTAHSLWTIWFCPLCDSERAPATPPAPADERHNTTAPSDDAGGAEAMREAFMRWWSPRADLPGLFDQRVGRTVVVATIKQLAWSAWQASHALPLPPASGEVFVYRPASWRGQDPHDGKRGRDDVKWVCRPAPAASAPLPVALYCPKCGARHVDEGEWATRPHHKHLCLACGFLWRVEPYCVGVAAASAVDVVTHDWSVSYPRDTWPVYRCERCSRLRTPTAKEMGGPAPAWFSEPCQGRRA